MHQEAKPILQRPSRSEQTAPLCAKTNRDTSVPEIEVLRETSRGTQPPSLSSFWTFIDRNGKTHSEPLLNVDIPFK